MNAVCAQERLAWECPGTMFILWLLRSIVRFQWPQCKFSSRTLYKLTQNIDVSSNYQFFHAPVPYYRYRIRYPETHYPESFELQEGHRLHFNQTIHIFKIKY
ncbi:hypothetical protein XENTR_v10002164 [Xenopus tropicalis]|nr:hypothetical protein XENTR_v10002164 [Xenopus tropicalis]